MHDDCVSPVSCYYDSDIMLNSIFMSVLLISPVLSLFNRYCHFRSLLYALLINLIILLLLKNTERGSVARVIVLSYDSALPASTDSISSVNFKYSNSQLFVCWVSASQETSFSTIRYEWYEIYK